MKTEAVVEHIIRFACPVCGSASNVPCNQSPIWNRQFTRSILLGPGEVHEGRKQAAARHVLSRLKGIK